MKKLALMAVAAASLASPAFALPDDACQAAWNRADANHDGVLVGDEARPYIASLPTPPANGQIVAGEFLQECQAGRLKIAADTTPSVTPGAMQMKNDPGAPLAGANSFTESQARDQIAKAGYADISGLKKDDQGIWHGVATKEGKQVTVAVDYRGNVVTR